MNHDDFLKNNKVPKTLLAVNAAFAVFYFIMLAFFFEKGNPVLFTLLILGEIFHIWQALTFLYTIWDTEHTMPRDDTFLPPVDVFIPVAGEPLDVIEQTALGAKNMDYPDFRVFILNDGYVAQKDNWEEVELLAQRIGVNCITRRTPGGAKAGNINQALLLTSNPFVAFFDSDHVPEPDFLRETMPYFANPRLGFVQTSQFYRDQSMNTVTSGAWEQQALFFGAICKGKNRLNAVTMCGTNMIVRRQALEEVDGMCENCIAEDFVTGFLIHKNGWQSLYVPKVLAKGLAPQDFLSYYKQQYRWGRGALDLIFRHNLLFTRGLTWKQRVQYLSSVSFFLSGWVVLIDALLPVIFFFTGLYPIYSSTMLIATIFLPYILLMVYTIQRASNSSFTYRALAFSMSGFHIHISSSLSSLFRKKSSFSITSKVAQEGNFIGFVIPQMCYVGLVAFGMVYSAVYFGITPAWGANVSWAVLNAMIFMEYIRGALPQSTFVPAEATSLLGAPEVATNRIEA